MPAIHIHLLYTEAHNLTEAKTNREHGLVNTCITCGLPLSFECLWNQLLFSLLPLFPSLLKSTFSPQPCYPQFPAFFGRSLSTLSLLFLNFPGESTTLPFYFWQRGVLLVIFLSSFLLFPPSCEIAVVSYGFLFLRDGRWVHVGVEATKHAVSAQRAGQHTQRASCGYDSCHVHISALPIIKIVHTIKIEHGNHFSERVIFLDQTCNVKNLFKWLNYNSYYP